MTRRYHFLFKEIYNENKYLFFYSIFAFLILFVVAIDSWEYLFLDFSPIKKYNISKIENGRETIYLISLYISFILILPYLIFQFLIYYSSIFYFQEFLFFLKKIFSFLIITFSILIISHIFLFPYICLDWIQIESSLTDPILPLKISYLYDIKNLVSLQIKFYLINIFVFNFIYFFILSMNFKNLIKYKSILYIFLFLFFFYFYETEIYLFFFSFFIVILYIEIIIFIKILLK